MTELLWQATLLLAVAFFFGAVFACGLKRRYYYGASGKASGTAVSSVSHPPGPNQPRIEVAPRAAAEDERFNRAISGQSAHVGPATGNQVWPGPTIVSSTAPAKATAPAAAPAPSAPTPAASAPAPSPAPAPAQAAPAPVAPPTGPDDDLTRIRGIDSEMQKRLQETGIRRFQDIAALSAFNVKRLNDRLGLNDRIKQEDWIGQAQALATGGDYSPAPVAQPTGPDDDLTRIRGIDSEMQKRLKEAGIRRFQDIAALSAFNVKRLNDRLGLNDRIKQEDWVGQAQALATGGKYSRDPVAAPISSGSEFRGSGAPVKAEEGDADLDDDLTRIRGIDSEMQKRLQEAGMRRFQDIAALSAFNVKRLNDRLGLNDRIKQEDWVGQAQVLLTGGETYYSRRVDRGMPVPPTVEPASRVPEPEAAPLPAATRSFGKVAPSSEPGDDLTRIRGIDPAMQFQLYDVGVRRFADLAVLGAGDVRALEQALGIVGHIGPENWVGQAQVLTDGGETYFSSRIYGAAAPVTPAAPAAAETSGLGDMGYLRSVRSEALVGTEAAKAPRGRPELDDLKRIRGIGVLIEKKLNSLGIVHFEQVANWTGADIERISQILDFKGRIERENWIEQARILATGGETEFSRRTDG
jgi:predicted flap endonuclease-1-like 5' DNA nuclease